GPGAEPAGLAHLSRRRPAVRESIVYKRRGWQRRPHEGRRNREGLRTVARCPPPHPRQIPPAAATRPAPANPPPRPATRPPRAPVRQNPHNQKSRRRCRDIAPARRKPCRGIESRGGRPSQSRCPGGGRG